MEKKERNFNLPKVLDEKMHEVANGKPVFRSQIVTDEMKEKGDCIVYSVEYTADTDEATATALLVNEINEVVNKKSYSYINFYLFDNEGNTLYEASSEPKSYAEIKKEVRKLVDKKNNKESEAERA